MSTWNITSCQAVSKVSGHSNLGKILVAIKYQITAANGGTYSEWVNVPTNDLSNFKPYNQFTELELIVMVKTLLGNSLVQEKESLAIAQGERYALPWNT